MKTLLLLCCHFYIPNSLHPSYLIEYLILNSIDCITDLMYRLEELRTAYYLGFSFTSQQSIIYCSATITSWLVMSHLPFFIYFSVTLISTMRNLILQQKQEDVKKYVLWFIIPQTFRAHRHSVMPDRVLCISISAACAPFVSSAR